MNTQLDLATVLLLHKSSFLVGAFCFLYARWQSPRDEGLGILASGFLFLALASTLAGYGEQKLLPGYLWTLSSFTLGIGGYALFWIGVRRLSAGRRRKTDWLALSIPIAGAAIGRAISVLNWFGAWLPQLVLRVLLAWEFWEAGVEKYRGANWFADIQERFPFPFSVVPVDVSWKLATWTELLAPILLVLGLGTRMAGIALAGVRYDRWIRFMLPLMGILAVACLVMLGIAAVLE